jgi:hypothetical protein
MIKKLLFGIIIAHFNCCAQIPEKVIKDKTLLKLVDAFVDSLNTNDQGVITLELSEINITNDVHEEFDPQRGKIIVNKEIYNYKVRAVFQLNMRHFKYHVPSFYFKHRDRFVFVYSIVEKLIEPSDKDVNSLLKMLKGELHESGTYLCPTWWINVEGERIVFEQKGES